MESIRNHLSHLRPRALGKNLVVLPEICVEFAPLCLRTTISRNLGYGRTHRSRHFSQYIRTDDRATRSKGVSHEGFGFSGRFAYTFGASSSHGDRKWMAVFDYLPTHRGRQLRRVASLHICITFCM